MEKLRVEEKKREEGRHQAKYVEEEKVEARKQTRRGRREGPKRDWEG